MTINIKNTVIELMESLISARVLLKINNDEIKKIDKTIKETALKLKKELKKQTK